MTGAEELPPEEAERLRGIFERIPYLRLLGLEFISARRGEARFALEHRPELTRHEGLMHGGAVASLMDTASAFAVLTLLSEGQTTVTVDLTIHFLRPVLGGRVEATARVLRAGRRLATLAIDVTDPAGKLTATATTTYAILTDA